MTVCASQIDAVSLANLDEERLLEFEPSNLGNEGQPIGGNELTSAKLRALVPVAGHDSDFRQSQRRHEISSQQACGYGSHRVHASIVPVARPLTDLERDALELLLSADFPGVQQLRVQAASVTAERAGMIIDLVVSEAAPLATVLSRTPVQAVVDGDGYDGGLLLFVDEGRLSGLEYWWVTEEKLDALPPLSSIGGPIPSA